MSDLDRSIERVAEVVRGTGVNFTMDDGLIVVKTGSHSIEDLVIKALSHAFFTWNIDDQGFRKYVEITTENQDGVPDTMYINVFHPISFSSIEG